MSEHSPAGPAQDARGTRVKLRRTRVTHKIRLAREAHLHSTRCRNSPRTTTTRGPPSIYHRHTRKRHQAVFFSFKAVSTDSSIHAVLRAEDIRCSCAKAAQLWLLTTGRHKFAVLYRRSWWVSQRERHSTRSMDAVGLTE